MAYAVLIDQTRLQPEIVSLIFLLWGTLPDPNLKTLARAHLIALWCFAGLNKLLSPAFMNSVHEQRRSVDADRPHPHSTELAAR
jgi:hypothetical protein